MPQQCSVCKAPTRSIVDREYLAGSSFNAISRLVGGGLTPASIRRHCGEHLRRPALFASVSEKDAKPLDLGEVADRWEESIRDAEAVLADARERGDGRLMLSATQTRADLLERYSVRFGGTFSVGQLQARYDSFFQTMGRAIWKDPEVGTALAEAARDTDFPELADEIKTYARELRQKREKENTNA